MSRGYQKILGVLEEVQSGRAGSVVGSEVVERPAEVLGRGAVEEARVTDYAAVYPADSGFFQQGRPIAEQRLQRFRDRAPRTGGGVSAPYDVEVAVERAAGDFTAVSYRSAESEVRSERAQGEPRGYELDVGCRHELHVRVDRSEGVPAGSDRQQPDSRRGESLLAADFGYDLVERTPYISSRAPSAKKERDCRNECGPCHLTASFTAALSFS